MIFLKLASTALFALSSGQKSTRRINTTQLKSTTVPSAETTAESKYDNLITWLQSRDAEVNSKIEIKPSPLGGGFGAFVTESVEENELLFTVPRQACLTLKDAMEDPKCGDAFAKLIERAGPGGNTVVMAGYMAKEYLIMQEDESAADECRFGPYFMTLPWERWINNQEHVLFWSDEDVESYLKGSLSYKEAGELREEV